MSECTGMSAQACMHGYVDMCMCAWVCVHTHVQTEKAMSSEITPQRLQSIYIQLISFCQVDTEIGTPLKGKEHWPPIF